MDAPVYPPAARFVAPEIVARRMTTADTSIAELKSHPQVWAIVLSEIPAMDARIGNDMIKPHLGNFSLRSLTTFGIVKSAELDKVDVKLAALGEVK
ncbi:hypothetical protein LWE61_07060 [Sphingobium sufflavum]|uniref:hypothetical protein n=1 Tax=Sphingobium sufflavum TaxID=1129547 RepID=UPI001F1D5507|nr:hypothetical protein [Sphingobium sufflavum]MCE7796321.1 hypothetical protein [Sphingobium sufflavum]